MKLTLFIFLSRSPNFTPRKSPIMRPCNVFLFFLLSLTITASMAIDSRSPSCHPDQRDALSRFNHSFSILAPSEYSVCMNTSHPKTVSWRESEDCCSWEGVVCDSSTGDVVGLDLSCAWLQGTINSSCPLFSLLHLRSLSLAGNDFIGSSIPPEINVFSQMTRLNLSRSSISGNVPIEISQLSKMVSLDLSYNDLEIQNPTMRMLVTNLTQLEELELSSVDMLTVIPTSMMNLSSSLTSLRLYRCSLAGRFPDNIFHLPNLQKLDLSFNSDLYGTLPKSNWSSSLVFLALSLCSFTGEVPHSIGSLSRLVSLDLSYNELKVQNPTMRILVTNLTRLEELRLSSVDMSMVVPTSMMNFSSSLTSLDLSDCSLRGKFPDNIFQLPNLQNLDLSSNTHLHGTLPETNWSRSLASLSLTDCSFTGVVPHSIGILPRLTYLDLSKNNFTGFVDLRAFSTLRNLQFLGLSGLSISGEDATNASHKFPKLEKLIIVEGELNNFPCFLSSMPELRELSLTGSIVQELPGQCFNSSGLSFPQLETLEMSSSNLTKFPSFLSQSNKLRSLYLRGNRIENIIPSWFMGVGIDTLEVLDLGNNLLRGGIRLPWKRLTRLNLQNNSLEGPLPSPPGRNLSSMEEFVVSQNRFNGSIPLSICQLTSLFSLELGQNNLTGVIPPCLGNLTNLRKLDLSRNSLMGPLPSSLLNCTWIGTLDVSFNSLGGSPGDIFLHLKYLWSIDLSSNNFEGPLPIPPHSTYYFSVSNNYFSGKLSSSICNANWLNHLDLSNNSLIGTLPHCLKNITINLLYLNLRVNKFYGPIPEIFHVGSMLMSLDFSRNQFDGSLPRSLSNCQLLEVLDVGSNNIIDSFPDWLGDLPLKVLSLRSNKFWGHVSVFQGTRPFSELCILDLSNNDFEGNLSDNLINKMIGMMRGNNNSTTGYMFGNDSSESYSVMIDLKGVETEMVKIYVGFVTLDMSSNHFWGEIPNNIGLLKSLKGLNLSHNGFTGMIPASIKNLRGLESLDLSSNKLIGGIPVELVKLTYLGALNLSWNNLTGPIPSGGHFNTFSDSSFEGNPGLCGIPLTTSCGQGHAEAQPPSDQRDDWKDELGGWFEWTFVAIGFGSGIGIGISLGYMVLETGRPLCLARMVIRLEACSRKSSKRKALWRNARPH